MAIAVSEPFWKNSVTSTCYFALIKYCICKYVNSRLLHKLMTSAENQEKPPTQTFLGVRHAFLPEE